MKYKELRTKLNDTKISYENKIALIRKKVGTKIIQRWAVKCAESVLHIYESEYPNDTRVRDCINATTQYLDGKIGLDELVSKREAAISATGPAAFSAYSAANSAYSDTDSAYSGLSAVNSANSAAHTAISVEYKEKQENLNIRLLLECLVKVIPDTKIGRKLYPNAEVTGNTLVIKI